MAERQQKANTQACEKHPSNPSPCRTLLEAGRADNRRQRSRYTVGLEKLQSSADQVAAMQVRMNQQLQGTDAYADRAFRRR